MVPEARVGILSRTRSNWFQQTIKVTTSLQWARRPVKVGDEEVESMEDQAQGEGERDPALEICTLEACGVVLTIQSANLAAAHKARDALKEFMTKGRHDVASKVLRRSREEILRLAASPFSQLPPQQWD